MNIDLDDTSKSVSGQHCDCERKAEWVRFQLTETEYVCDWDDIHLISKIKE